LPDFLYYTKTFSRFDHSVGVMLLLRKAGASVEEQVAGLLHDVSHTAFSHLVDWVVGEQERENFQDDNHEDYINKTELPQILKKYGFSVDGVCDYHKFSLLEQDAPLLCADRIDYTLREWEAFDWLGKAKLCAKKLQVSDGRFVFKDKESANLFGYGYMKCQVEYWGSAQSGIRYELFAKLLKLALDKKIIEFDDLWQDDEYVLEKLQIVDNNDIQEMLNLLKKPIKWIDDQINPQLEFKKKYRWVDPEFLQDGKLVKLSVVDLDYANLIEKEREKSKKGFKVSLTQNSNF
jgi:hypothetical protein